MRKLKQLKEYHWSGYIVRTTNQLWVTHMLKAKQWTKRKRQKTNLVNWRNWLDIS